MRVIALLPALLCMPTLAMSGGGIDEHSIDEPRHGCWECSITLATDEGAPWLTKHVYTAARFSAEACADALYDQIVADWGTSPTPGLLMREDGGDFEVDPAWVAYYATVVLPPDAAVYDECDDSDWAPLPPAAHDDGTGLSD